MPRIAARVQMNYPSSELVIDPVMVRRYDVSGPGYTSYPTADRFVEAYGEAQLRHWVDKRRIGGIGQPLSVYVHLPFCDTVCLRCACDKVVTRGHGRSAKYIKYLIAELGLLDRLLGDDRGISQLHWGGGTPALPSRDETRALADRIKQVFQPERDCECSIEIDPRRLEAGTMAFLAELGFNRVSIGVQNFGLQVHKGVSRVQSEGLIRGAIEQARAAGFRSVNLDLIYGLPKQTLDSFNASLDQVLALDPDRIALYSYAHLPRVLHRHRRIAEVELPASETRLQIQMLAIGRLTGAGYLYIGMDHFAKPGDELAVAQRRGGLHRSFQGYSARPDGDLLGLGVSAIGQVGPTYYQNRKRLGDYYAALDGGQLPVMRGVELTQDDLVRRAVIRALMCNFRLSIESIELSYLIDFRDYFARELQALARLAEDGLVELQPEWIVVTPAGRLLVRVICTVFDRYAQDSRRLASCSRLM